LEGLRNAGNNTGTTQFSFSNTGSLVYLTVAGTQTGGPRQMAFIDFNGKVTPLRHVPGSIFGPRISPDGTKVAYRDGGAIWIADLNSEAPPRQLTSEPGEAPIWSPDGKRIAFISILNGMEALYWRLSDGTGAAELLAERARAPESWAADNQSFTYITLLGPSGDAGDYDIWTYSIRDKKSGPLITIPMSAQSGSRLSPDGKWIAYESNETGRAEVFVEPLPRSGQRFQVSKSGGARPLWAPDMSKLYFDNNAGSILSVGVRMQPSFTWSDPEALPIKDFVQPSGTIRRQYDITPDGKQFMMMIQLPGVPPQIEITNNWFDQLKPR
jgi:serine/threonine-protein kinase